MQKSVQRGSFCWHDNDVRELLPLLQAPFLYRQHPLITLNHMKWFDWIAIMFVACQNVDQHPVTHYSLALLGRSSIVSLAELCLRLNINVSVTSYAVSRW